MWLAHPVTLGAGIVFLVAGILLYRRRGKADPSQGSQGAVILIMVGAIMAIYGLGLLEYRKPEVGL